MSTVPSTVANTREQIREAVRLSLTAVLGGVAVPTMVPYSTYDKAASFPVHKAYYDSESVLKQKLMGSVDIFDDTLYVEICPWCIDSDFEYQTSLVIAKALPTINVDIVRSLMYGTYQNLLNDIKAEKIEVLSTNLDNPYAAVLFTLKVSYRMNS